MTDPIDDIPLRSGAAYGSISTEPETFRDADGRLGVYIYDLESNFRGALCAPRLPLQTRLKFTDHVRRGPNERGCPDTLYEFEEGPLVADGRSPAIVTLSGAQLNALEREAVHFIQHMNSIYLRGGLGFRRPDGQAAVLFDATIQSLAELRRAREAGEAHLEENSEPGPARRRRPPRARLSPPDRLRIASGVGHVQLPRQIPKPHALGVIRHRSSGRLPCASISRFARRRHPRHAGRA
jgi:hypothetical protein